MSSDEPQLESLYTIYYRIQTCITTLSDALCETNNEIENRSHKLFCKDMLYQIAVRRMMETVSHNTVFGPFLEQQFRSLIEQHISSFRFKMITMYYC